MPHQTKCQPRSLQHFSAVNLVHSLGPIRKPRASINSRLALLGQWWWKGGFLWVDAEMRIVKHQSFLPGKVVQRFQRNQLSGFITTWRQDDKGQPVWTQDISSKTLSPLGHWGGHFGVMHFQALWSSYWEGWGLGPWVPEGPPATQKCKGTLAAALVSLFEFTSGW